MQGKARFHFFFFYSLSPGRYYSGGYEVVILRICFPVADINHTTRILFYTFGPTWFLRPPSIRMLLWQGAQNADPPLVCRSTNWCRVCAASIFITCPRGRCWEINPSVPLTSRSHLTRSPPSLFKRNSTADWMKWAQRPRHRVCNLYHLQGHHRLPVSPPAITSPVPLSAMPRDHGTRPPM